jgi:ribosomal protein S6
MKWAICLCQPSPRRSLITIEEKPKNKRLAYAIKKPRIGNFESAYFGWVKFVIEPEAVKGISDFMSKNPNVLRFIAISAVEESVIQKPLRRIVKKEEGAGDKKEEHVSPEEVDKKLEELLGK